MNRAITMPKEKAVKQEWATTEKAFHTELLKQLSEIQKTIN
jgi:hypothetical protein